MKWGRSFALILFVVPSFASAQVVISEIMYNPQGSDTGREWVELNNQGTSDVAMIGGTVKNSWRIGDGTNHTFTDPSAGVGRGSLVIPAGGYLVIATDPNEFISGEYAGGSYSVVKSSISLNNTGSTISLLDGNGTIVDSVSYANTQGAVDDGSSLQRQADASWIAALPTPGQANSITPYVPPQNDTDQATSSSTSKTQTVTATPSYIPPPTPNLFADAGDDRTVIVGADAEFDASAYDKSQDLLDPSTVRFIWNFGDGGTAEGAAVLHHFSYPGNYAVILEIAELKNSASDEITVTAEPAALAFSLLHDGGVHIENDAGHNLDLSGWIVRADENNFSSQFMLPEHSIVLSGSAMNISAQTLSFRASSSTLLEYPNGAFAFSIGQSPAANSAQTEAHSPTPRVQAGNASPAALPEKAAPDPMPDDTQTIIEDDPATSTDPSVLLEDIPTSTIVQTASVASSPMANYLWWLGAALLACAAGVAAIAFTGIKSNEWDIVEEKTE